MRFFRIVIMSLGFLGSAWLNAAISDSLLQESIDRAKYEPEWVAKRCLRISAEKAMKKNARNVEKGFLTQEQGDLLNREGYCAFIDSDGDLELVCPFN